ncbi:MAG: hypothetical protein KDI02_26575, partial [Anaerolineae bacterium]|nr:hypothetical protein [Anaerolineae bacterium]
MSRLFLFLTLALTLSVGASAEPFFLASALALASRTSQRLVLLKLLQDGVSDLQLNVDIDIAGG